MAVPKSKISKERGNTRYANWKLTEKNLVECSNCHAMKENHKVCKACGYYNGKPIIVEKEKADR